MSPPALPSRSHPRGCGRRGLTRRERTIQPRTPSMTPFTRMAGTPAAPRCSPGWAARRGDGEALRGAAAVLELSVLARARAPRQAPLRPERRAVPGAGAEAREGTLHHHGGVAMKMMSDPLADRLQLIVDGKTYVDNVSVACGDDLATAVRAYWREHRPAREEVAERIRVQVAEATRDGLLDAADALLALFDRALEAPHRPAATMNGGGGNGVNNTVPAPRDGELSLDERILAAPLRWRTPRRIFVCSMTDLFGAWMPDEWIDRIFAVMALAPQHT